MSVPFIGPPRRLPNRRGEFFQTDYRPMNSG
jgi:hypothetical protein